MPEDSPPSQRRHLALFFPFLPVDRLMRHPDCDTPDDTPLVLVEKVRGAMRIAATCSQAAALGLNAGLALADARAQVPLLAVTDHDPAADLAWLERLADHCDRFTPLVAIEAPDALALDITGCAHLFGGEAPLLADVARFMARWSDDVRLACGDTPEAAQALARFAPAGTSFESEDATLRRLPVAALRIEEETQTALIRAGLKTIGDLAMRPSAPLAARFGEDLVDSLDRLLGTADSRITPRRAAPALRFERRFAEPIGRTEAAMAAIGELAEEAAVVLEQRGMGGRRFIARFFRSDGRTYDLATESSLPMRDPDVLMRLLNERLAALADPVDPGFGFDMIRLAVPRIEPLTPAQLQLEGGCVADEAMAELVDRLSTRLGRGAIRRFEPRDSHVPEQAALTLPAVDLPAPAAWDAPQQGEPPARPIHLFDPPQPIEVIAEVPDGPPHRFRWRRSQHHVVRFEGPERIAAQWWKHAPGKSPGLTRDYYRVEDARGRRFWIFRHGLYETEKPDPRWYVHGLFA
ncbi:DNA polymerase Y family protein [Blastomonas sp.]|uniref:Y-family DNA polymerase n=1 Tax=Blastomonas sp. TaxID=1909299 RepID=UPI0026152C60|nr:DNA polymerase Y family protein [Blastomonas sp.]MDM7957966.1 DNA polymerase Y family protein [Blastomonas sp.]